MKMDKREIILCLLFVCLFITMIFIRAFAVDADPGTSLPMHGKQSALDILQDDTTYTTWLDNLRASGADVASNVWSSAADMARNLLAYGVGCLANTTEEVLQVAFPDLEHYLGDMYFDWDRLEWEFTDADDVEEFIKSGLDSYAYDYPSPGVGYWVPLPASVVYNGSSNYYDYLYDGFDVFICNYVNGGSTGYAIASRNSSLVYSSQSKRKSDNSNNGNPHYYNLNGSSYNGTLYSGVYASNNSSHCFNPELTSYSSLSDALAYFFGHEISGGDPVLNGDVLYFDNPSLDPLGYYPSTALNFETIVNEGHTNNYDYSVVNNYNTYYPSTFTFDIPYWLKVPSTVPKIYDLPSDYDFQNIQFDYEADVSFLDGSGVIQDVYDVLPLKLQNLIILFGAGTCAFLFLRR